MCALSESLRVVEIDIGSTLAHEFQGVELSDSKLVVCEYEYLLNEECK